MKIIYWPFPFNLAGHIGVLFDPYEDSHSEFLNFHQESQRSDNSIFEPGRGSQYYKSLYSSFGGGLIHAVETWYERDITAYGDNLYSFELCHLESRYTTERIRQLLNMINNQYKASGYKLLWRNCGHYIQDVLKKLNIQIPFIGTARLTGYYTNPKGMILAILSKKLNELNKVRDHRLHLLRTSMLTMTNEQYATAISSLLRIELLRLIQEDTKNNQSFTFKRNSNAYIHQGLSNNINWIEDCLEKINNNSSKEENKKFLQQLIMNLHGEIKSRVNEILTGFPYRTTTQDLHWLRTMR